MNAVIAGNFGYKKRAPAPAQQATNDVNAMMKDLGLDNLVIVGKKSDRQPVVAYFSSYNGADYFTIKSIWQKQGQWQHGKGLSVDPGNAKELLNALGQLANKL